MPGGLSVLSEEQRFAQFSTFCPFVRTDRRLFAVSGESETGLAQIAQGVDGYGLGSFQHLLLALQADARWRVCIRQTGSGARIGRRGAEGGRKDGRSAA